MSENRLENLEIILAHQEQQMQDMSEMITAQWKEIDRLKAKITRLEGKIEETEKGNEETSLSTTELAAMNKPPHY